MVQDTAWDGYEEIPAWIMQGYGTMAMEADEQLHDDGCERPTHIFIQAGVGSLAGAVQGYFANRYPDNPPKVVVVEAAEAACLYKGAAAGDGEIRIVDGDMADDHGRSCLRRAQHHLLGYPEKPCGYIYRCS